MPYYVVGYKTVPREGLWLWLQTFNVHRGGGGGRSPFNYTLNMKDYELLPHILSAVDTAEYLPIKQLMAHQHHCSFNPYQR